ncbi:hypothetical protein OIDMADRAFT_31543 [Oidiodendron maius Zn]|uniref:Uncharacterized protein n=1 Tax=Oidiodendron maius (strain Zn) TaxID=913774 RepID=A0A0C3GRU6_OIDMZ|nr:hypothetical protein OIDMADRAFT_31543 [Oidiodendron maius Zn]
MDNSILATRLTKQGWLGKPNLKLFFGAGKLTLVISIFRLIVVGFYLAGSGDINFPTEVARHRQRAFAIVSFLFALSDWIPYLFCTWQRQPSILTKWITPAMAAVSILFHVAWTCIEIVVDRPNLPSRPGSALLILVVTSVGTLFMTLAWLYFTFDPALRLPTAYEPVLDVIEQGQAPIDSEDPDSTDSSGGPLASLYQVQQSFDYDIEERSDEAQEQGDNLISNLGKTTQMSTANFSPALVFWHTKLSPGHAMVSLVFLGLVSIFHVAVQLAQYFGARGMGEFCDV